ncbi:MAG TPA: peptidoglycan DD-metalloendopeptidase family protein [Thermomicrobiaceae bacterium]|nr:peptidoglycan DD-metalloendopeptidase family protein [Thermomicrobiaceae bacterium]
MIERSRFFNGLPRLLLALLLLLALAPSVVLAADGSASPTPTATSTPTGSTDETSTVTSGPFTGSHATATVTAAPAPPAPATPASTPATPAASNWGNQSSSWGAVPTPVPTTAEPASDSTPAPEPAATPAPTPDVTATPDTTSTPEPNPTAAATAIATATATPTGTPAASPSATPTGAGTPAASATTPAAPTTATSTPPASPTPATAQATPAASPAAATAAPQVEAPSSAAPSITVSPNIPTPDYPALQSGIVSAPDLPPAGSVVPATFAQNMSWSEESGWHWVYEAFDGSQRFTSAQYDVAFGVPQPVPYYVATLVRTLGADDACADCVMLDNFQQGPPKILGGADNPALTDAYAHIKDGARQMIKGGSVSGAAPRWTKGAWYLNYDPTTGKFFSWTWVPEDWTAQAMEQGLVPSQPQGIVVAATSGPGGVRLFPLAGSYQITQPYGCVPANAGYPSPGSCPASRPSFHDGVDLGAPAGTPIFAAASGTVIFAGIDSTASGNSKIVIQLDGDNAAYQNIYLHWRKSFVGVGMHVSAGQVIAEVGSVGYSTGPHLHFTVVRNSGGTVDPLAWLRASLPAPVANARINPADAAGIMGWATLVQQAAAAHTVPAALLAAIMTVESDGNPRAISPQGAQGLMQVMPDEFQRYGIPVEKWLDPATNIDTAARILAETLGQGGAIDLAIQRYFGIGCDALGTCTDVYLARVQQWVDYYQKNFPS